MYKILDGLQHYNGSTRYCLGFDGSAIVDYSSVDFWNLFKVA